MSKRPEIIEERDSAFWDRVAVCIDEYLEMDCGVAIGFAPLMR